MANVLVELNTEFQYISNFDAYGFQSNEHLLQLTEGKTYRVAWDADEYEVIAYDAGNVLPGCLYLGNATNFGLPGNNEPFIIGSDGNQLMCLSLVDTEPTTHSIVIYGEAEGSGNALADLFGDIADAIRTKTGNTDKMAPASFPTNILGIVTGGSGSDGGEWVSADGSFTAEATSETIEHNLGVVPDIFMVTGSISGQVASTMTDKLCLISSTRVSERLIEEAGLTYSGVCFVLSKSMLMSTWISYGVETPSPSLGEPYNATKTTIMVGGGVGGGLIVGNKYSWIAIGRKS